jgi:hypothetical protein
LIAIRSVREFLMRATPEQQERFFRTLPPWRLLASSSSARRRSALSLIASATAPAAQRAR